MSVYKAYRYDVFAFPQGYYRNEMILFRALHYWEFRFLWEQFFFESADIQGGRIVKKWHQFITDLNRTRSKRVQWKLLRLVTLKAFFFSFF